MSSNRRRREYQRRRYLEWQHRLGQKVVRRRVLRRNLSAVLAAVAVIAVVGGVIWFFTGGEDEKASTAAATPTPAASASTDIDPKNPCPKVTAKAPANPVQLKAAPAKSVAAGKKWTLGLDTSCGGITAELDGAKAPQAVSVVVTLARKNFYDGSPCHRVTTSGLYVLQCGDPTGTGSGGPGFSYGPVENAPKDGVYPKGTLAMARGQAEDSNGSQFFIVYKDTKLGGKYSVIGKITKGLGVVTKVAAGGASGSTGDGTPRRPISIKDVTVSAG